MTEASEAHDPSGPKPSEPSQAEAAQPRFEAEVARPADESTAPSSEAVASQDHTDANADASASSPGDETESAAAGEGESSEGESSEGASSEGAPGDGAPSGEGTGKRRRRRRKKGKGRSEAGEQDAPASAEGGEQRARPRASSIAPFVRFFVGAHAGRKHGFAVDEAVAGRVKEVAHGVVAIDLFGKALAYADEHEPREVPPLIERETHSGQPVAATEQPAGDAASAAQAAPRADEESAGEPSALDQSVAVAEAAAAMPADAVAHAEQQGDVATDEAAADQQQPEPPSEAGYTATAHEADATGDEAGAESQLEPEAHGVEDEGDGDADGDGETTLAGEASPGHGPLPAAPVVPDSLPRLEPPRVGQVFRGRVGAVSESGHIAIVNRHVDRKAVLANLERYRADRRRVQGLVFGFNRGGFDVLVEGARAFCPASAMSLEEIDDPIQYLGQKLEFLLPASQAVTKDIIVSRRSILERQLRKKARELVRSLEPGQRLKGRVTQVREFGVFVDIGGIEGLVHQSELSFAHGVKPSDVAQVGEEVEVQVLRVGAEPNKRESGRRDRVERVSLSIKALLPDPWDAHADALKEGSAQPGKVTRTTDFGAFIEIAPQIEGLLHITELGRDLKHANQAVKEGDELQVVIERVDRRARRISLSKLSAQEAEELQAGGAGDAAQSVRPGSRIKVKVARVESRGLVVRVAGVLGRRARGYVPGSELPGGRGGDLRKLYPVGSELEVKVVGIDRDGGLRCSPKALAVDEERRAVKDYRREAAKQGFGTFGDLLRAKLGQADQK